MRMSRYTIMLENIDADPWNEESIVTAEPIGRTRYSYIGSAKISLDKSQNILKMFRDVCRMILNPQV